MRELSETDVLMLRKLEAVRQHFGEEFDLAFRRFETAFIDGCTYDGKKISDRKEFDHLIKGDLEEYRNPVRCPEEFNGKKVFQLKDWTKDFSTQVKPGDFVSAEVAAHFLFDVPPAYNTPVFIQCGEPYARRRDKDGKMKPVYTTFESVRGDIHDEDSVWRYCGHCFLKGRKCIEEDVTGSITSALGELGEKKKNVSRSRNCSSGIEM